MPSIRRRPGDAFELQNAERAAAYQETRLHGQFRAEWAFPGHQARRAGDIVTVKIEESSSLNKANTKTSRDSNLTAGVKFVRRRYPVADKS
jgi:flagellar basal body L-ring protein FlgH